MIGLPADILKPGLKALYYSGAHRLLAPISEGVGIIFMLHRVLPGISGDFAPNAGLTVTPEFLDTVLCNVREAGLDIVSMDEAHERVTLGLFERRFACFTLDDGYKDNAEHAFPVFRAHDAPFTIYVPSDFPEGKGELWWVALEDVIRQNELIDLAPLGSPGSIETRTTEEKFAAFDKLYAELRDCEQDAQRQKIGLLAGHHGIDIAEICRRLIMSWDEIRDLARSPLVTIGAHTVKHFAVSRLTAERARHEMKAGADRIAEKTGTWPHHFSFPYGDEGSAGPRDFRIAAELGFKTAVTTRKGLLFPEHANHLTALPRVSLNGSYQSEVFTRLYLSGAPFALWNRFRRVNAA